MVDFNLNSGSPTITDDIDLILQQVDILFDTHKGEVFGDESFGTEYERYLYDLLLSNTALAELVKSDISKLDLRGYLCDVLVYLLLGTQQDIALIDINFKKDNKIFNKTYKIS